MANYLIQDTTLTNMANKIRSISDGSSAQYTATQMVTELGKMESEIDTQTDLIIDLIAAINNLPNAGGGGEDLEALGVLCHWDVMTNESSYPVITINNEHPTYYLKCTVYNENGTPAIFDDGQGDVVGGDVIVAPNDWATFLIEEPMAYGSVYVDDVRWTKNV